MKKNKKEIKEIKEDIISYMLLTIDILKNYDLKMKELADALYDSLSWSDFNKLVAELILKIIENQKKYENKK